MTPSFIFFHAENVNEAQNSICHLIIIPVVDGQQQPPQEFFFNPEAPFLMVMSGITRSQVESFAPFSAQWPRVQELFSKFDMAVSSAEGNSARSLYGTLTRLGIDFKPIAYCNAKAICRRTLNEVSYSFDYLNYKLYNDCIYTDDPVGIAKRWCELALRGLSEANETIFNDFFISAKIKPGVIAPGEFTPSLCLRDYSNRKYQTFDSSSVAVDARPDNPLFGMNVVFTGKMDSMKRDEARAAVVKIGGNAPERLTQETDLLVVGVQDLRVVGEKGLSGKMKTAEKYRAAGRPIEIIDEADFLEMLNA
ncbi:BRCT domain-containing protein [uncultured Duncaniella sp.]|uniref:BRCT domain-containing protein n=1 Tax=uncultured Duncaniella sp. TaxID=2768039 RepID=UPI0025B62C41|nr:BRCT domain-containing protein [uncultured Duncaniella sp.]